MKCEIEDETLHWLYYEKGSNQIEDADSFGFQADSLEF